MANVRKYLNFVGRVSDDNASDEKPFCFNVWPSYLETENEDIRNCYVFLSFADAAKALDMLVEIAPTSKKCEASEDLIQFLEDNGDEDSGLLLLCAKAQKPVVKPFKKPRLYKASKHTLFHKDGATAHGTRPDLAKKTGLEPKRVADLCSGRRSYFGGWSLSEERALEGPRRPGRPRKTEV